MCCWNSCKERGDNDQNSNTNAEMLGGPATRGAAFVIQNVKVMRINCRAGPAQDAPDESSYYR